MGVPTVHHPFIDGIFPGINHPAIGNPIFREQLFGEKLWSCLLGAGG